MECHICTIDGWEVPETVQAPLLSDAAFDFCPFKGGFMAASDHKYHLKPSAVLGPNACRLSFGDDSLDLAEVIHFLLALGTIV